MQARFGAFALKVLTVSFFAATLGIATGILAMTLSDLPQVENLETYEPKSVTTILDIHGNVVHEFYREKRIPVPLEKIPVLVRKAFLVAEDWRFYDHFGIDLIGLFRATIKNLIEQRYAEGASTITQQLAKNLFLSPEKTLGRKFKEAALSIQIERRYSKNEILSLYLNQIYLGQGCYGVETASQTYFGKSVNKLSLAEAAMLAGLPKGPNLFSPFHDPEKARIRRDTILQQMFERNILTKQEWDQAKEEPLPQNPGTEDRIQSYFAAYVSDLLGKDSQIGEDQLYKGYLAIQSTLDLKLQRAAELAVERGIENYAKRHKISPKDKEKLPQAALLAIHAQTGEIRALVGGRSFQESQFNRALFAIRQPGSAFKPVLYAATLERGYTQSTLVEDTPISFTNVVSQEWNPENYENEYDGWIPLRVALEKSKNVVAIRLLQTIGISSLQSMALRLGTTSPIAANLSSALGSSSLTLPELVRIYATFVNGGMRPELHGIRSVRSNSGMELWHSSPINQAILDPQIAFLMTDLLSGVIRFGTGSFANDLPCTVGGKTGTTDNNIDSLFVGFTSNIVAAVWMGFDERKSLGPQETGAKASGPIWKDFMSESCNENSSEFIRPSGIVMVEVDHSSGLKAGQFCTDIISEAFIEGTAPTETCHEEEEEFEGHTTGPEFTKED